MFRPLVVLLALSGSKLCEALSPCSHCQTKGLDLAVRWSASAKDDSHASVVRRGATFHDGQYDDATAAASYDASRRYLLERAAGASLAAAVALWPASPREARADVSDGNQLPQGAAQFARVLRLSQDLKGVRARVSERADEIDGKEWDNIGKFLRTAYAIADQDMKSVAAGIASPENQKRALKDADQLKTYAQAGDVPVSKKDGPNLVPVLDKMSSLVTDFLDSLRDVPDEI